MANQRDKNGKNIGISWCDNTINLWWGCSKIHTGCKNCYAESLSKRFGDNIWGDNKRRKLIKSAFPTLDKIQERAQTKGVKETVFIGSMMDIFELNASLLNPVLPKYEYIIELRNRLFRKIDNKEYENLIFLLLTKRPENIKYSTPRHWEIQPPHNVWIGVSISDNNTHWKMRKGILDSGWVGKIFYSIEPQISEINTLDLRHVDWVIQGCESGPNRRPFDLAWAYKMKRICKEQKVSYFLKQIQDDHGRVIKKLEQFPKDLQIKEFPKLLEMH